MRMFSHVRLNWENIVREQKFYHNAYFTIRSKWHAFTSLRDNNRCFFFILNIFHSIFSSAIWSIYNVMKKRLFTSKEICSKTKKNIAVIINWKILRITHYLNLFHLGYKLFEEIRFLYKLFSLPLYYLAFATWVVFWLHDEVFVHISLWI